MALADDAPVGISEFAWYARSIGPEVGLAFTLAVIVSLMFAAMVPRRANAAWSVPLLVFTIPLPLFFGMVAGLGSPSEWQLLISPCESLKLAEIADYVSMSLARLQIGLWLSLPGYVVAASALINRALNEGAAR